MSNKTKTFVISFAVMVLSIAILILSDGLYSKEEPKIQVGYQVYLKGEHLGYLKSEKELNQYINNQEESIKKEYKVDKVYTPENLSIQKVKSYDISYTTPEKVYNEIKNKSPFTIEGYEVIVEPSKKSGEEKKEKKVLYVKDKKVLDQAIKSVIQVFISSEDYDKYIKDSRASLQEAGYFIESIKNENQIVIKKTNVPTDKKIYTDPKELGQYMLFGKESNIKKYIVKPGENIKEIANNNKLSVSEFLLVNPNINDANKLMYVGEEVNVSVLDPIINVEEKRVENKVVDKSFESLVEYDPTKTTGYRSIKQQGIVGKIKVTYRYTYLNNQIISVDKLAEETLVQAKPQITILGTRYIPSVGDVGIWACPVIQPCVISSPVGWRTLWGKPNYHEGVDLYVPGWQYGSPIYAANNGLVVESGNDGHPKGNYVFINHNNGYYTTYLHLSGRVVSTGQVVERGQLIGYMGATGSVTGPHLHFGFHDSYPYRWNDVSAHSFNGLTSVPCGCR